MWKGGLCMSKLKGKIHLFEESAFFMEHNFAINGPIVLQPHTCNLDTLLLFYKSALVFLYENSSEHQKRLFPILSSKICGLPETSNWQLCHRDQSQQTQAPQAIVCSAVVSHEPTFTESLYATYIEIHVFHMYACICYIAVQKQRIWLQSSFTNLHSCYLVIYNYFHFKTMLGTSLIISTIILKSRKFILCSSSGKIKEETSSLQWTKYK